MIVKVINKSDYPLPSYETSGSSGMDLKANIKESITLNSLERVLIPTGIYIELKEGYEAQVRPRSGLTAKHGISVVNTPGTIDSDYRGQIHICAINLSNVPYTIEPGERLAQLVFCKYEHIEWEEVEELTSTERGTQGHGHTGKF